MMQWTVHFGSTPSHRHPGDIIRLGGGAVVFSVLTGLAFSHQVKPFEEYVFRAVNALPNYIEPLLIVIMQMGAAFFVPIAALFALTHQHKRLPLKIVGGGIGAWIVTKLAKEWVNRDRPAGLLEDFIARNITTVNFGFPSGHSAVAACLATVIGPYVPKRWRWFLWLLAWIVAIARVYVGVHLPMDVFAGLALGWMIGSLVNLFFGTPDQPIPFDAIKQTLRLGGLSGKSLSLSLAKVDARGSVPMHALHKGKRYFVKFVTHEQRNADFIYKAWRYFIMREVEDEAPFARALQLVEHEAYLFGKAQANGVHTPMVLLAAPVTHKSAVLVSEKIDGVELSNYKGNISDLLLRRIWGEVLLLRKAHIAHRDLRTSNIMIDRQKRPWLIDFSFAETAISDRVMAADIVELLVSLSHLVGPQRAVQSALSVIDRPTLVHAARYLQPLMLSSVTRRQIRSNPGLLDDIRAEVSAPHDVSGIPLARVSRFRTEVLVLSFALLVAGIVVMQHVDELSGLKHVITTLHPVWLLAALAASAASYAASAFVLLGASPEPIAYGKSLLLQVASSAVNRVTPRGVGSIALTERFLHKKGLDHIESLSTISLVYFFGAAMHILLLGIAAVLLDQPVQLFDVDVSRTQSIFIWASVILAAFGLVQLPKARYFVKRFGQRIYKNVRRGSEHPASLLQLVGGSAGVTLAYALGLYFSLLAVGVSADFHVVLMVYLSGSALAAAAPTPGGLGAAEAALAAGLAMFNIPLGEALAGVLVFRLVTFWLPIIPGVVSLRYLRSVQLI